MIMKKTTIILMAAAVSLSASAMRSTNTVTGVVDTRDYMLTVSSDWGNPVPGVGTNVYDWHETVECWVNNTMEGETILHIVDGYEVNGNASTNPGEYHGFVVLSNLTTTLSWNWVEDYLITTDVGQGLGGVSPSFRWIRDGSNAVFNAEPGYGYLFIGWSGASSEGAGATSLTYTATAPAEIVANFSDDPDGDGLKNTNEWAVGADPWMSDTDGDSFDDLFEFDNGLSPTRDSAPFLAHIQDNPEAYGIDASNGVVDVAVGQIVLDIDGATARLSLQVEQSEDLVTWTNAGDAVEWTMPVGDEKAFLRVRSSAAE